jgi:hypothetical protein
MARLIRLRIRNVLPPVQIPVKVQREIDLPAVTTGPVRIGGGKAINRLTGRLEAGRPEVKFGGNSSAFPRSRST